MKLIKCYVSSFGKLKDFSYDFTTGLNTFKENNGWGKSTLASFIKAMFYGLNSGKRSVAENERIKFKPWNTTERFGGILCFEKDGKQYRLERYFGNKESEDTIKLFDDLTGKEYSRTENLGFRLFKVDEDGFLSTTYFSQKDFQIKSNSSLTAKYNSVCEIEDSDAFDKALLKVEEKAKLYKYRGDKGAIADVKRELNAVDGEIFQAVKSADALGLLKQDLIQIENRVDQLKGVSLSLTEKVAKAGKQEALKVKKERYEELLNEKENITARKLELESVLNGRKTDLNEISAYSDCNNELNRISTAEKVVQDDLNTIIEDQPKVEKNNNFLPFTVLGVSFITFIISMIFAVVKDVGSVECLLFLALTVVFAVLCVVLFVNRKSIKTQKSQYSQLVERKKAELLKYQEIRIQYENKIDAFINLFRLKNDFDRTLALSCLYKIVEEYDKIILQLKQIEDALSLFGDVQNSFSENDNEVENINLLNERLKQVNEEYAYEAGRLANKRAVIKNQENFASSITDLESKKSELSMRLEQYSEEYEVLTLTAKYLKQADENLKVKYRAPLQNSLNKYLQYIDGGKIVANIDIDLAVTIDEKDGKKVVDYYSKGYQNLFEICKRFALTDVLFSDEKPFIILDDPFYNLDDEKLVSALDLIKKLSNEYQILYFVCHESRRA